MWSINDGILQKMTAGSPLDSLLIPRVDIDREGSYPKNNAEYFSSVASAVYLSAVMDGDQKRSPRDVLDNFTAELSELVGDTHLDGEELVPVPFAQRIHEGWQNYQQLRLIWPALCARLGSVALENAYNVV